MTLNSFSYLLAKLRYQLTKSANFWLSKFYIKNYLKLFSIEVYHFRGTFFVKVRIFWEGHNILQNLNLTFVCMYCTDKGKVEISQNFAAFSEYMNFIDIFWKIQFLKQMH